MGLAQVEGETLSWSLCALKSHRHGRPLDSTGGTTRVVNSGLRLVCCRPGPLLLESLVVAIGCVCVWGILSTRDEADCDLVGCPTSVDDPSQAKNGGEIGVVREKKRPG